MSLVGWAETYFIAALVVPRAMYTIHPSFHFHSFFSLGSRCNWGHLALSLPPSSGCCYGDSLISPPHAYAMSQKQQAYLREWEGGGERVCVWKRHILLVVPLHCSNVIDMHQEALIGHRTLTQTRVLSLCQSGSMAYHTTLQSSFHMHCFTNMRKWRENLSLNSIQSESFEEFYNFSQILHWGGV